VYDKFLHIRMKLFLSIFFSLLFIVSVGQNLIPNPSVENPVECPETLGAVDASLNSWFSIKGSPDYFHSCSENELLGWNSLLGYQEPLGGDAYLGLITYIDFQPNTREYIGVTLNSELSIGAEYTMRFHISLAFSDIELLIASNNIGVLFLTDLYLDPDEFGVIPNYSSYNLQEVVTDTTSWTEVSFTFIADSAYQYAAFGNFYDDDLTDTTRIDGEEGDASTAYYFLDEFCLSPSGSEVCEPLSVANFQNSPDVVLYPNPSNQIVNISCLETIEDAIIYNSIGQQIRQLNTTEMTKLQFVVRDSKGVFVLAIKTASGVWIKKRFVLE